MMKKYAGFFIRYILVLSILGICFIEPFNAHAASKARTLRELRQELASLQAQKNANNNKKKLTKNEISQKNAQIDNAYSEIQKSEKQITEAKALIVQTNENINTLLEKNKNLLRYFQMLQSENVYVEFIADASSMTEMIMRSDAVNILAEYQQEKMLELEELIKKNEQLQVDLKNYESTLAKNITTYEKKISTLQDDLSALDEIGMDIEDEIRSQKELIAAYEKMGCSEDQDLQECSKIAGNVQWLKPLKKGRVNSIFGTRKDPFTGASKVHKAVDIGGNSEGTSVYSAGNGVVIATVDAASKSTKTCGGNQVYIQLNVAGEDFVLQYAHLLKVYVKVGDKVSGDTVIGTQGGGAGTAKWEKCSTGTHLHFGVAKGTPGKNSSVSSFFSSHAIKPPGYPSKGSWFYSRTQFFS